MVSRRFPPDRWSGSETVFQNLYKQACTKHEVKLVAGYVNSRDQIPAEAMGVDLRELRWGRQHVALWSAARAARWRYRPDVVLSNSMEVPSFGGKTTTIVHDLNFGRSNRSWNDVARERYYVWKASRLGGIVTPSVATRDALVRIGCDANRIQVIANGVDLDEFCPASRRKRNPRKVLLCPGRIVAGKGQHLAIDAVRRLPDAQKSHVLLRVVGSVVDPVYYHHLKLAAAGEPVEFATEVEAMAQYYQHADLVLFPTLMAEGFGYTAVEAMACGRPVVWSEQPAIREATGGIGVPVIPTAEALITVIQRFLERPRQFSHFGRKGRAFVEEHYRWEQVWARYEAVLRQATPSRA